MMSFLVNDTMQVILVHTVFAQWYKLFIDIQEEALAFNPFPGPFWVCLHVINAVLISDADFAL